MSLTLIIDDTATVADDIVGLTGVNRFGNLIFQRRRLVQRLLDVAAEAGLPEPIMTDRKDRLTELGEKLAHDRTGGYFLLFPTHVVAQASKTELVRFLRQLTYTQTSLQVTVTPGPDWAGLLVVQAGLIQDCLQALEGGDLRGFIHREDNRISPVDNILNMMDIRELAQFLIFITGNFDVRHFNAIKNDKFTVIKESTNGRKLKQEFEYYYLLPPKMQIFFVQPYDFVETGTSASYKMERLYLPDMAVQWLHGAITPAEFDRFLGRVFHFVTLRPTRQVSAEQANADIETLYIAKVAERIRQLKALPQYAALEPLIGRSPGSIDSLYERYVVLFARLRGRFRLKELCIGHGDLCFSNILYSKTTQLLRFIDPRGASTTAELYVNPYYDVAKLSHSILGGYDFINAGQFEIAMDNQLGLGIASDAGERAWAHDIFRRHLADAGFDPVLVRLCEASLFLSMLPLHIDVPKKVVAFVLNARTILDELETS